MSQVYNNPNQALINAFNSGQHLVVKHGEIKTENFIMHGLRKILGGGIMTSIKDMNIKLRGKMAEILQNSGAGSRVVTSIKNNTANNGKMTDLETALMRHTLGMENRLEQELEDFLQEDTSKLSDSTIVQTYNKKMLAGLLNEIKQHMYNCNRKKDDYKPNYGKIYNNLNCSDRVREKVEKLTGGKVDLNNPSYKDRQKIMQMIEVNINQTTYNNFAKAKNDVNAFAKLLKEQMGKIKEQQNNLLMPIDFDKEQLAEIRKASVEAMLDFNHVKKEALLNKDELLELIDTNSDYGKALEDVLDSLYYDIKKEVKNLYRDEIKNSDNKEKTLDECFDKFLKGESKYFPKGNAENYLANKDIRQDEEKINILDTRIEERREPNRMEVNHGAFRQHYDDEVEANSNKKQAGLISDPDQQVYHKKPNSPNYGKLHNTMYYSDSLRSKVDTLAGGNADRKQILTMLEKGIVKHNMMGDFLSALSSKNAASLGSVLERALAEIKSQQDKLMPDFDEAKHAEIRKATVETLLDSAGVKRVAIKNRTALLDSMETKDEYHKALVDVLTGIAEDIAREVTEYNRDEINNSKNPQETFNEYFNDFVDRNTKYAPNKLV